MTNKAYKGTMVYNDREKYIKDGKVKYKVKESIEVDGAHPAIIPPEDWELANIERDRRAEQFRTRVKPKNDVFLLSDLVFCSVCKHKMAVKKDPKTGRVYIKKCEYLTKDGEKCTNAGIMVDYVEKEVLSDLKAYKSEIEAILRDLKNDDTIARSGERFYKKWRG